MAAPAATRAQLIDEAIMEAARSALPELDPIWGGAEAAPVFRQRHLLPLPALRFRLIALIQ